MWQLDEGLARDVNRHSVHSYTRVRTVVIEIAQQILSASKIIFFFEPM